MVVPLCHPSTFQTANSSEGSHSAKVPGTGSSAASRARARPSSTILLTRPVSQITESTKAGSAVPRRVSAAARASSVMNCSSTSASVSSSRKFKPSASHPCCWLAAGVALELCRVEEGPGWARVAAVGQVGRADRLRARTVVATGILTACLLVLTLLALGAAPRPSGAQALAAGAAALYAAVLQVAVEAVVVRLTGTRRLLAAEEILLALLAFVPVVPLVGLIVPALPSWRPDRRARRA